MATYFPEPKAPRETAELEIGFCRSIARIVSVTATPLGSTSQKLTISHVALSADGQSVTLKARGGSSGEYLIEAEVVIDHHSAFGDGILVVATPSSPGAIAVAELGARVLRKLGIALVPQSRRLPDAAPRTVQQVAADVLRNIGIVVPESARPTSRAPLAASAVAAMALQWAGIGRTDAEGAAQTVTVTTIAERALLLDGINPHSDVPAGIMEASVFNWEDVAKRVLLKLDVIAPEDTPAAQDLADTRAVVASVHDSLVSMKLAGWTVFNIPQYAVEPYVIMVGNLIAPQYGKAGSVDAYASGQEMLRVLALTGGTAQARAEATVLAVHYELATSGLITWQATAIPQAVSEHYARMAAALLAPVFGKPLDSDGYGAAEARIKRAALSSDLGLSMALEKVQAVHEELNAMGLVSWPDTAIPWARAEDYAQMAATLISAFAGLARDPQSRQMDATTWDAALERVRKAGMISGAEARAEAKVRAVHAEVSALGLATWDADAIPASMADAYEAVATLLMQSEAGKMADSAAISAAYQRIRLAAMNGPAGQALAEQKVRAVHRSLEARGRTRWTIYDIPLWAEEPYVFMAAALLAPECGMKADPSWGPAAEIELLKITAIPSLGEPVRVDYF